jgi:hypothetical protein
MGKVLHSCKIKRAEGYLYFVDKKMNTARVKMARRGKKTDRRQEVLCKHPGMKREKGYLYYVDKGGNMACAKMARR